MTPSLVVFAPSPLLTITIEAEDPAHEEIHLHAGGQGFWVARMAALLGADVALCAALGGESGTVLRGLVPLADVELLAVEGTGANGAYVHLRRNGGRQELARTRSRALLRHEADELYGVTLSAALDSGLALLTGTDPADVLEADVYRRLAGDLRRNGVRVIADLSGRALESALAGGLDVLKISVEEVLADGWAAGPAPEELVIALGALHEAGASTVLLSRAEEAALVFDGESGRRLQIAGPKVEPLEARGTGDSMFAALGASLAAEQSLEESLRVAVAAGCLNATRHGLGTGTRQEIEHLSRHVVIEELP